MPADRHLGDLPQRLSKDFMAYSNGPVDHPKASQIRSAFEYLMKPRELKIRRSAQMRVRRITASPLKPISAAQHIRKLS